jgi:cell division septum initiation protein DivIVA
MKIKSTVVIESRNFRSPRASTITYKINDEDGDFRTKRSLIAGFLGLVSSFLLIRTFEILEDLRNENAVLNNRNSIATEIARRKRNLRYCSLASLLCQKDDIETELSDLKEKSNILSSKNRSEIEILDAMLDELDYRIGETEQQVRE